MCHVDNFFGEGVKGPGCGWVEEREREREERERERSLRGKFSAVFCRHSSLEFFFGSFRSLLWLLLRGLVIGGPEDLEVLFPTNILR